MADRAPVTATQIEHSTTTKSDETTTRDRGRRDAQHGTLYEEDPRHHGRHGNISGGHGRERQQREYTQDDYEAMYDEEPRNDTRPIRYGDEMDTVNSDRPGDRDELPHRSRSGGGYRSRSRSPGRDAGRPSDTVILEGLPRSISQNELRESLLSHSIASESPTFDIRIPSSKGHRRAFIQFDHVDRAIDFVQEHYPKLIIHLRHSTDEAPDGQFTAYLHYARSRDDAEARAPNADWICPQCAASNFATRSVCRGCGCYPSGVHWEHSLTGAADVADSPSQILVVFPLPPFVDEEMLGREMKRLELERAEPVKTGGDAPKLKSTAPTSTGQGFGASQGSLHRVFLMRDSQTNESFRYGFAEFWTVDDAASAVKKYTLARNFSIAGCAVNISTIHMGVFLQDDKEPTPATEKMSFHPLFNPSIRVRYRDDHVYPSQMIVAPEAPASIQERAATKEQDELKRAKKRKADGNLGNSAKKPPVMAGKMAMWQRKHDEIRAQVDPQESSARSIDGPKSQPSKLSSANATIKISLSSASKLIGQPDAQPAEAAAETLVPLPGDDTEATPESYMDRDRLMCLICMRKYKSTDEVSIHERSRNHKTAIGDPGLVKAALPRLAVRDKRLQKLGKSAEVSDSGSMGDNSAAADKQYRDRARERREAYRQPKKPAPQHDPLKDKPETPSAPAASGAPIPPAASKGANLLAKMGWTAGAGLGANGEGRTDVIETNAYQEGVGLGAEGSNLGDAAERAGRQTRGGYAEYVSSVQDKARERYNKLE
ncbi:G-patch domain protein, putative [Cordyceps militaris CM01]|uniref:G-patch domain protein, putative n=1 Tax=Cordyceps militaris (strain CM01) TaxID=983644 RepID=G3J949_CORMM|nr:G-patch domain protein, putative [Cordyceps militaris CM01]EGX94878.1 G-patch domain protein, putative [Cordyceps militaris CM01]